MVFGSCLRFVWLLRKVRKRMGNKLLWIFGIQLLDMSSLNWRSLFIGLLTMENVKYKVSLSHLFVHFLSDQTEARGIGN